MITLRMRPIADREIGIGRSVRIGSFLRRLGLRSPFAVAERLTAGVASQRYDPGHVGKEIAGDGPFHCSSYAAAAERSAAALF